MQVQEVAGWAGHNPILAPTRAACFNFSMPITFKSKATGNLVMVSAHADALLQSLGKPPLSASPQGILEPQDMPVALAILNGLPTDVPPPDAAQEDDEAPRGADEPVSLRKRAWPLIQMIERAQAANEPIVWGV